ncbi:hypothetical protein LTR95_011252 [Oleoguttula sp. CCFEE 5521]
MTTSSDDDECTIGGDDEIVIGEEPLRNIRTEFGPTGTIVYGWPSTGGVWVHEYCSAIELDFLGLPRFETCATDRYSDKEDHFCDRLQRIGATFYKTEHNFNTRMSKYWQPGVKPEFWYGWPRGSTEGGVWALWTRKSEGIELGTSRIKNALSMEERCTAIEALGGKFYERWDEVAEGLEAWSEAWIAGCTADNLITH